MKPGFTLVELVMGLATAAVVALVSAQLFLAGLRTYQRTVSQAAALRSASRAQDLAGSQPGMLRTVRSGYAVAGLSVSSLTVLSSSGVTTGYALSNGELLRATTELTAVQAGPFQSLSVAYYNIDASGRIMQSTAAESAELVTTLLTVPPPHDSKKSYTFFSGAQLRNHP